MTSHDVRDVLNLPADGAPRPAKKAKISAPRQSLKGLAREVQSLGGGNPIAIVPPTSIFKKRRLGSRKPATKWTMAGFTNSAREDGSLVLRHWRRQEDQPSNETSNAENGEGESGTGEKKPEKMYDSAFAKFNVQIPLPQYNEDQYNSNLQNPDWTKDETDYLLGLVRDFDQRWSIIWDRYDYKPPKSEPSDDPMAPPVPERKERDIDDLKARYYEVAASMMVVNKPKQYMTMPEFNLYETMANFNASTERARRRFAIDSLSRSKEEAREEESLLLEVKRILARAEQLNEQRRELYQRLDFPPSESDVQSFKSSAGLQQLLQNLMAVDKSKKRKSMMENGVSPGTPAGPESAGGSGHGRRESVALSHRDTDSAAPTPTSARPSTKKGGVASSAATAGQQQQAERRKLTETEEVVYGVSHHDRLTGGATFRYEKINKLFSHKSGQQQQRITNVLTELGIPARLVMPTGAVVARFEALIQHVNTLLDTRKVSDKMEAELKTENAKREARRELEAKAMAVKKAEEKKGDDEEAAAISGGEAQEAPGREAGEASDGSDGSGEGETQSATATANGDDEEGGTDGNANTNSEAPTQEQEDPPIKEEVVSRPGSSGQKRSASVLGSSDDDRSKRQKK